MPVDMKAVCALALLGACATAPPPPPLGGAAKSVVLPTDGQPYSFSYPYVFR